MEIIFKKNSRPLDIKWSVPKTILAIDEFVTNFIIFNYLNGLWHFECLMYISRSFNPVHNAKIKIEIDKKCEWSIKFAATFT